MRTSAIYLLLSIILTALRFTIGKPLMNELHVVFAADAIYLLFIGVYYAKWRLILKKIDMLVYDYAEKKMTAHD